MIVLPADRFIGDANHDYDVVFEGVQLYLTFRWHERIKSWYMDIRNADGDEILVGIRIVIDIPLDLHRRSAAMPPNMWMLARDLDGTKLDPEEKEDLGTRITIMFIERDAIPTPTPPDPVTITLL